MNAPARRPADMTASTAEIPFIALRVTALELPGWVELRHEPSGRAAELPVACLPPELRTDVTHCQTDPHLGRIFLSALRANAVLARGRAVPADGSAPAPVLCVRVSGLVGLGGTAATFSTVRLTGRRGSIDVPVARLPADLRDRVRAAVHASLDGARTLGEGLLRETYGRGTVTMTREEMAACAALVPARTSGAAVAA